MMKKLTALFIFAVLAALMLGTVTAGAESTNYRSETNKLEAVVLVLESVDMCLEGVLAHPPRPCTPPQPCVPPQPCYPPEPCYPPQPCKAVEGVIGKLEAMSTQLLVLDNRTAAVINSFPPEPVLPQETMDALMSVQASARAVMERAQAGFHPPEPCTPPEPCAVLDALYEVEVNAEIIVTTVDSFMRSLPTTIVTGE